MRLRSLFLALAVVVAVPACGSDPAKPSGTQGAGETASTEITAAEGGEVTLGDATLDIPADALEDDETITVKTVEPSSSLPDYESVQGLIYDFGPDGTEFTTPVTLTLPAVGEPGDDEEAVISWLDEDADAWQDLATTVNRDGSLSAEVSHFTMFAVRFNGVVTSDCDFEACGGDVAGTWEVTGVCVEPGEALIAECPDVEASFDMTLDGTFTFESDDTTSSDLTSQVTITYTLSAECMDTITGGNPPADCSELDEPADEQSGDGPTTCTGDPEEGCTCVAENPEKSEMKTGTYSTDGDALTMTDDEDGEPGTSEYCVKGDELRVKSTEGLALLTWIATKQ
jgi:hypothetical protein